MTNEAMTAIDPSMTVNEIIRAQPTTVSVFQSRGIDSCCGGALPLATVAEKHRLDLNELLAELRQG